MRRALVVLLVAGCDGVLGIHAVERRPDGGGSSGDGGLPADGSVPLDGSLPPDADLPDATPSQLGIVPGSWDFMGVDEGTTTADETFTVQNQGASSTSPLTATITGGGATAFAITPGSDACTGIVLAPLDKCMVGVHFIATGAGASTAYLAVSATTSGTRKARLDGRSLGNDGTTCGVDGDCQSGNCVSGTCCDMPQSACGGCQACDVSGHVGTCWPIPSGMDPNGTCTALGCSTGCNGSGGCTPSPATTICKTEPVCANFGNIKDYSQWYEPQETVHRCDGTSTSCPTATGPAPCPGGAVCNTTGTACLTSCATDFDCAWGFFCDSTTSQCTIQRAVGSPCDRMRECRTYPNAWCLNGSCQNTCNYGFSCATPTDWCVINSSANTCVGTCTGDGDCLGNGGHCTGGICQCQVDSDCSNQESPYCLSAGGTKQCGCFSAGGTTPTGCRPPEECVDKTATVYAAACYLLLSGYLCDTSDPSQCQTGVCNAQGICQ
jgi:hypothetical protein